MEELLTQIGKTAGANLGADPRSGFGLLNVKYRWDMQVKISGGTWSLQVEGGGGRAELEMQIQEWWRKP